MKIKIKENSYTIISLLLLLFYSNIGFAQNHEYRANFKYESPIGNHIVTDSQYEELKDILQSIYSSKNLFSHQSPFIIVPSVKILSEKIAGEIQVVKVVKIELGLTTQGINDDYIFHKFRQVYTITAENSNSAISKAIQLVQKEQKLKTFFDDCNKNIVNFYESNCATILNTVKVNIEREEYAKAFDYLRYVPETVNCYQESEKIITKIYLDSKEENCRNLVQKAHAAESQRDYSKALYYLQFVETNVNCYSSATALVEKIGGRVDEQVIRDFEMEKLKFSKLTDLKKMEILSKEIDYLEVTMNE